ncbi:MAG: hypothetical protein ACRDVW_07150 [Acidimicrobiales bacterium]
MSYVDAGYAVGLSVLFLYGLGLMLRRRNLERAVDLTLPSAESIEGSSEANPASGP